MGVRQHFPYFGYTEGYLTSMTLGPRPLTLTLGSFDLDIGMRPFVNKLNTQWVNNSFSMKTFDMCFICFLWPELIGAASARNCDSPHVFVPWVDSFGWCILVFPKFSNHDGLRIKSSDVYCTTLQWRSFHFLFKTYSYLGYQTVCIPHIFGKMEVLVKIPKLEIFR